MALEPKYHGTVTDVTPFDPEADAEVLRKAMKGMGCDRKALIRILGNRTARQRLLISKQFKTMFGKDMVKNIKAEVGGHFEELLVACIMDPFEFDAKCLRKAMKGRAVQYPLESGALGDIAQPCTISVAGYPLKVAARLLDS
eukprot:TRINITY_DN10939_c0_g1_i3.p2 TRINITY_DN10939_c0_g1~~TRINITY_DN10939_c0_g1_i3.p2  ORF type:complete len:142 (+),score=43.19 TRINITY_DN10939_c0_g1_i3:397-822(+)